VKLEERREEHFASNARKTKKKVDLHFKISMEGHYVDYVDILISFQFWFK